MDNVRLVLSFEELAGFMWTEVKMRTESRMDEGRLETEVKMYMVDWRQIVEVYEF